MKKHNQLLLSLVALAASLSVMDKAHAQGAGSWIVKAGVVNISPNVSSGDLSAPSLPGTKVDIKAATTVSLALDYMLTDNFSVEFLMGWPPRHEIVGAGAINGAGSLGSIVAYTPSVLGQYRFFSANDPFRPYVGAGLTYAAFGGGKGTPALTALTNPGGPQTTPSTDSKLGLSLQLGGSYAMNSKWSIDGSIMKTFIKTKNTLSTGQTIDTKLDPLSVGLAVGYRF